MDELLELVERLHSGELTLSQFGEVGRGQVRLSLDSAVSRDRRGRRCREPRLERDHLYGTPNGPAHRRRVTRDLRRVVTNWSEPSPGRGFSCLVAWHVGGAISPHAHVGDTPSAADASRRCRQFRTQLTGEEVDRRRLERSRCANLGHERLRPRDRGSVHVDRLREQSPFGVGEAQRRSDRYVSEPDSLHDCPHGFDLPAEPLDQPGLSRSLTYRRRSVRRQPPRSRCSTLPA